MMIKFLRNGDKEIWVAFDDDTGQTCGKVTKVPSLKGYGHPRYQVWVAGIHGIDIAQGAPHTTLLAAQADLEQFFK